MASIHTGGSPSARSADSEIAGRAVGFEQDFRPANGHLQIRNRRFRRQRRPPVTCGGHALPPDYRHAAKAVTVGRVVEHRGVGLEGADTVNAAWLLTVCANQECRDASAVDDFGGDDRLLTVIPLGACEGRRGEGPAGVEPRHKCKGSLPFCRKAETPGWHQLSVHRRAPTDAFRRAAQQSYVAAAAKHPHPIATVVAGTDALSVAGELPC